MRAHACAALAMMLALWPALPALGQEVPLERFSDMASRQALIGTAVPIMLRSASEALPGLPPGPALSAAVASHGLQLALSGDSLYLRSGSGGFEKLPLISAGGRGAPAIYGPAKVTAIGGGSTQVEILLLPGTGAVRQARMAPAGFMKGTIDIDGRKVVFGVADSNLNGRFGDLINLPVTAALKSDLLAVDENGDGQLTVAEVQPLGQYVKFNEGLYRVAVAADGSKGELTKADVAIGKLTVADADAAVILVSPNGLYNIPAGGSELSLPAGRYQLMQVQLKKKDAAGQTWQLTGKAPPVASSMVEVIGNETAPLKVGQPLQMKLTAVVTADRTLNVTVSVLDSFGTVYDAGAFRSGERMAAPGLQILDPSGKVLKADTFSYG